jgi:hypothetical protein
MPRVKGPKKIAFKVVVTVPTFERLTAKARVNRSAPTSLSVRNTRLLLISSAADHFNATRSPRTSRRAGSSHGHQLQGVHDPSSRGKADTNGGVSRLRGRLAVRSTPARALRHGQLIVDRYSVSKITAEPYRLPHNTVSVELTDQITGVKTTRTLRWGRTCHDRTSSQNQDR